MLLEANVYRVFADAFSVNANAEPFTVIKYEGRSLLLACWAAYWAIKFGYFRVVIKHVSKP